MTAHVGKISQHFDWDEVLESITAERLDVDNTPPADLLPVLELTAQRMDRVRRVLSVPVHPSSWYRTLPVNCVTGGAMRRTDLDQLLSHPHEVVRSTAAARIRRGFGVPGGYGRHLSQHTRGEAVDFRASEYGTPAQVFAYLKPLMRDLGIDQLIIEFSNGPRPWVHVSFSDAPRHQALGIDEQGARFA